MHSHLVEEAKRLIKELGDDPDSAPADSMDVVDELETALNRQNYYTTTMNVVITAMAVSTMRPIWGDKCDIAASVDECISPRALVEKYLAATSDENLEQHMKRRQEWGHGGDFEDNFTTFEMANVTTITFFDMDNEIIILVAKNSEHSEE